MSKVAGESMLQSRALESLTSMGNYQDWLTSLALPYLGDHPLELGSGIGDYAQRWLDLGVPRLTVSELDPSRLDGLRARFAGEPRVDVREIDVAHPSGDGYSCVVAFNVLEHIEDDVAALRGARELVEPGGHVVIFVPAFEFAYGRFDAQVGHYRRYRKRVLQSRFEQAGLTIEELRYVNAPGLLSWFAGVRVFRMPVNDSAIVRVWDLTVTPVTRRIESRRRPPFGQSLFVVARA